MNSSDKDQRDKSVPSTLTDPASSGQDSPKNAYRPPSSGQTSSCDCDQIICLLDKIARTTCLTANEVHRNGTALKSIATSLQALIEMYRTVNPAAALDYDRQAKMRAQLHECCPPEEHHDDVGQYVP